MYPCVKCAISDVASYKGCLEYPRRSKVYKRDVLTGMSTQLAALHGIVDSMALNHQGRLFAAQVAPIPALREIDPQGVTPPRMVATVIGMDGIDTGPDGHVYTPDFFGGREQCAVSTSTRER